MFKFQARLKSELQLKAHADLNAKFEDLQKKNEVDEKSQEDKIKTANSSLAESQRDNEILKKKIEMLERQLTNREDEKIILEKENGILRKNCANAV